MGEDIDEPRERSRNLNYCNDTTFLRHMRLSAPIGAEAVKKHGLTNISVRMGTCQRSCSICDESCWFRNRSVGT